MIYPTIKEITKENYNRYTLVIATAKSARHITDQAVAAAAHKQAVQAVDKAVNKGILHKNTAARKKSSMTLHLNKMA